MSDPSPKRVKKPATPPEVLVGPSQGAESWNVHVGDAEMAPPWDVKIGEAKLDPLVDVEIGAPEFHDPLEMGAGDAAPWEMTPPGDDAGMDAPMSRTVPFESTPAPLSEREVYEGLVNSPGATAEDVRRFVASLYPGPSAGGRSGGAPLDAAGKAVVGTPKTGQYSDMFGARK